MTAFALDPRLAGDTHLVADFDLCRVLLMDDARFPWLILVPRRIGLTEIIELSRDDQHALLDEVDRAARTLHALYKPDKLNVAALGNLVAQLHVHVIARFHRDAAWPRPVWGVGERAAYPDVERAQRLAALRLALRA